MTNMPAMAGSGGTGPLAALRNYQAQFEDASFGGGNAAKVTKQSGKGKYSALIAAAACKHGVPVRLARAVIRIESSFNARAHGGAGEIGLMQIKPATARGIGYRGPIKALYDPATNLEWGMRYLAKAHQLASGDTYGTILRYSAGHYARRMNPVSKRYCHRVLALLGDVV
ncbi:transglycosylase SLT domain-containing protein [Breoghania sp.]|uniref:lytic transglycosylase domain-containing protein n=1 Tax=Breoghania sp. TaxID=2065378 RepID=UPI00260517A0|nr:transglycosylase SLT domain-containing protein [Breoghania sp.]MDJ0931144.1 transglycosylase SLT domain-containing protein [Breoghania sp.]